MTPHAFRARRVIADRGDGPCVIDGGYVAVADGRVVGLGGPDVAGGMAFTDLGDVLLAPGFVNAHTHLELSAAPFVRRPAAFSDFLWAMRDYRLGAADADLSAAAGAGAAECLATGTTAAIDLVTSAGAAAAVAGSGLRGALLREVLGLVPARADACFAPVPEHLASVPEPLAPGVFLHAPYSVSVPLRERCLGLAASRPALPLATHLLESPDEVALLTESRGPMADELRRMGFGPHLPAPRALEEIVRTYAEAGMLLVHLAAMPADLARHLPAGSRVVLCPRSNANLGVGPAPYAALRAAGVVLALGTDSRASCETLDMRDEMRAACDAYAVTPRDAFLMATSGGAEALRDRSVGRIAVGARADLVAVADGGERDAFEAVIAEGRSVARIAAGPTIPAP